MEAKVLTMWGAILLLAVWSFRRFFTAEKASIRIPIDDR